MATRQHVQRDFSGGEVSRRLMMRADTEMYQKSVMRMVNWMPTLQGSAVRTPGTQFVYELLDDSGNTPAAVRLIPYRTTDGKNAFLELTPGKAKLQADLVSSLSVDSRENGTRSTRVLTPTRVQIMPNGEFLKGEEGWELFRPKYTGYDNNPLGLWVRGGGAQWDRHLFGQCRNYKYNGREDQKVIARTTAEVEDPTSFITLSYDLLYSGNTPIGGPVSFFITIGTARDGKDVYDRTEVNPPEGTRLVESTRTIKLPSDTFTGTLHIKVEMRAYTGAAPSGAKKDYSTPAMRLFNFLIWANKLVDVSSTDVGGTVPYTKDDLESIHYIQSPYPPPPPGTSGPSKELVMTMPLYPPQQFYYKPGTGYVFEEKDWVDDISPTQWITDNYPATCTSFNGRLVLAGGQRELGLGAVVSSATETVWCTRVGNWSAFDDTSDTSVEVTPADSIEFTAIYRSPIQWVYGQKTLAIGALEMEYTASADTLFQPADLGVSMQHTHGSINVQPVGFGESIMFPADGGTKVRAMSASNDDQGWVAPDMTLLHPELCASGIRRMVRLRNPQQMLVCVLNDGQLALLHQDSYANVAGWSRISLDGGAVEDACVVPDDNGFDMLFVVVRRRLNGVNRRYVEVFNNWRDTQQWTFLQSYVAFVPENASSTVQVEHLPNQRVAVVADGGYLGTFLTDDTGTFELTDSLGNPVSPGGILVGLSYTSELQTLPIPHTDPGVRKRLTDASVWVRSSTRPIINGERPYDRDPPELMNLSQPLDFFASLETNNVGWSRIENVTIEETLPLRCEILGIFGKLAEYGA